MPFRAVASALILLLLLPALALAGWELEYSVTTDHEGTQSVVVQVDADHIRVKPQSQESEVILGPDAFTVVDHSKKTVMTVTYTQLEAMFGGMASMMSAMQEAQKKAMEEAKEEMSAEELEAFEEKMSPKESPVTFKPVDGTETVAGLQASKVLVLEEGKEIGQMFMTSAIPVEAFTRTLQRIIDIIPEAMMQQEEEMGTVLGVFQGLTGFPLKVVSVKQGEEATLLATSANERDFSADTWKAPAGYKAEAFPLMNMGGMGSDEGGW